MSATIKIVAKHAGVSVATVSKYLNGGNVIEENRIKVQQAVDALGYKINEVARSLKTNKTYTVGVLASTIVSSFISEIISSVQISLLNYGYSTIIVDYQENKELEKKQLDVLLKRQVDGIIVFPAENEQEIIKLIQKQNIPVIIVDNMVEGVECDAILTDNMGGIYSAMEELIKKNHKRIGIVSGPDTMFTAKERLKGYVRAHEDYALPLDEKLIETGDYHIQGGYQCMLNLLRLEQRPTAVVIANYYMAIGALKALNEGKIKIPQDISIVSFDQLEFSCILETEISTIWQPCREIGELSAKWIVRRIQGDLTNYPQIKRLKTTSHFTDSIKKL